MAEHLDFYQRAVYYDVVFDRDVSVEVDFICAVYQKHAGKSGPNAVLDIACGPGYHALEFARRGIAATGLDLGHEMLQLAQEKADAEDLDLQWIEADMRRFNLKKPVDAAFIMFDGIDALLSNDDLVQHFNAVAKNLTPKGIYLIDLTHPKDCSHQNYGSFRYSGARDGVEVEILWATNAPVFDPVSGVAQVEMQMRVHENGDESLVTDVASERLLLPQEIALLAQLSGQLKVAGWYGDYSLDQPLDSSAASLRMLAVLQKSG